VKQSLFGLTVITAIGWIISATTGAQSVQLAKTDAIIPYYATLERGLAEAKRTGKPILFVSAAPHCAGVSGMW